MGDQNRPGPSWSSSQPEQTAALTRLAGSPRNLALTDFDPDALTFSLLNRAAPAGHRIEGVYLSLYASGPICITLDQRSGSYAYAGGCALYDGETAFAITYANLQFELTSAWKLPPTAM